MLPTYSNEEQQLLLSINNENITIDDLYYILATKSYKNSFFLDACQNKCIIIIYRCYSFNY